MPVISAIFFVIALILGVVFGPQTRPWTWGPAMLALGIAVLAALPVIWKRGKSPADFGMLAFGMLTAGWFAWRAWISPVAELGQADLLLVTCVVGTFVSIRAIAGNPVAERILSWGIAALLLANVVVIGKQMVNPDFCPVFASRPVKWPSGFFGHYNEAANYLIACSMLVGAAALFGRHAVATRILWALIAIAGLAAIWFTRSRGGIFGAAVACGVFAVLALMMGRKNNTKWFAPALIGIPVIGLGIAAFLFMGWQEAQGIRFGESGIDRLLDNDCRLYFLGISLSCIGLHPLTGGGSRSFGWECFKFWDLSTQGAGSARPEFVHNELVQAATDYGLVGIGLLVGLLGALVLAAILRVLFEESPKERDSRDAWRLGALAALAGMLVQSSFSFVFHLLPGILLLGICLGMMSRSTERPPGAPTHATRILLTLVAAGCALLLLPAGWKGIQVSRILWPTYFSKQPATSAESRIDALSDAIQIWPQSTFYEDRAFIFQTLATVTEGLAGIESTERAINDYLNASLLNPFDPGPAINRANLLSQLKRDAEAEEWFAKAIQLQGGLEAGFKGHFSLSLHLFHKGLRLFHSENADSALDALESAATHVEEAVKRTPYWSIDTSGKDSHISIHESLGTVREATGDRDGALQAYDFACTLLPNGTRAHYRAGVLIGKKAVEAWSNRRPAEAMKHFIEARQRVEQAGNNLPQGVTPSQRIEYIAYLDNSIAFLKGAKIEPLR